MLQIDAIADTHRVDGGGESLPRRHALQHGAHRRQDQAPASVGEPAGELHQSRDAPRQDLAVGRHPVIGQAVPGRQLDDFRLRGEETQRLGGAGHALLVARDVQVHARGVPEHGGECQGIEALGRPGEPDPARPCQWIIQSYQAIMFLL